MTATALGAFERLPTIVKRDAEATVVELSKPIDNLASGKNPGNDGIPLDLLKQWKSSLLLPLHEVLCQCWREEAVPQDMRDTKVITLYKNKGERSDHNIYSVIHLLSILGRVFARAILIRLQKLAKRVYPVSQNGFRSERSTIDMIFSLKQFQRREQQIPQYIAFIDFTKAFELIKREEQFKILPKIGSHQNCRA